MTAAQLMTHYANDYFDLEADRANRTPTRWSGGSRVLPAGVLPPRVALRRRAGAGVIADRAPRSCWRSARAGAPPAVPLAAVMTALAWGTARRRCGWRRAASAR